MTFWEILGIQETTDTRKIRHAYAAMSKECHPETDPERFQQLYQAYQCALAFAKGNRAIPSEDYDNQMWSKEGAAKGKMAEQKEKNEQAASFMFDGLELMPKEAIGAPLEPEMQIPEYIKNISGQRTDAIIAGLEAFRETFEAKGRKDWKKFMTRPEFLRVQFKESFVTALSDYLTHQTIYPIEKLPYDLVKELVFAYYPFMEEHGNKTDSFEKDGYFEFARILSSNERYGEIKSKHDAPDMYNEVVKYRAYYGIYSSIKKTGEVQNREHWDRYLFEIAAYKFYVRDGVKIPIDTDFYPMLEFLIKEGPTLSMELYSYLIERFKLVDAKNSPSWQDVGGIYQAIEEKGILIENVKKMQEQQKTEIRLLMEEIEKLYSLDKESDRAKIREFFRSEIYERHKLDSKFVDDKLSFFACVEAKLFSKIFAEEYIKFYDEVYAKETTETGKRVYARMKYYRNTDLKIGEEFLEIMENRQEWVLKYFFEEGFTYVWPVCPDDGMPKVYQDRLTNHLRVLAGQRHYERDLYTDGHQYALRKEGCYLFVQDNMEYGQMGEKTVLTIQEYYHILEKLMEFYLENYTCTESTKEEWNNLMERAGEICGCNRN